MCSNPPATIGNSTLKTMTKGTKYGSIAKYSCNQGYVNNRTHSKLIKNKCVDIVNGTTFVVTFEWEEARETQVAERCIGKY